MGGLGKTQIAIEYVYSRKHEFDAIFWVHAADPAKLANDFMQIAIRLDLAQSGDLQDQVIARDLVLEWLSTGQSGQSRSTQYASTRVVKWLIVFDNAESLTDLRDYWPTGLGSILVTSRDPLAKTQTYFYSPHGLELEPFKPEESAAWLRKLTHYDKTPEDIELSSEIVDKLSHLPLAISQVAGAIHRQNLSFSEFLEFYKEEPFRAQIYRSEYGRRQMPIWAAFAFKELSAYAASLLDVVCFLDPDSIPERLFTSVAGTEAVEQISLLGFPQNNLGFVEARTELTRCSLLRRNVQLKELTVHRIVQDSAIADMAQERLVSAFRASLRLITLAWPSTTVQDYNVERGKKSAPLLPHIVRLRAQYDLSPDFARDA